MTEKIYDCDAFRRELSTVVAAAEPSDGGEARIALAATVFFPEGGGQKGDTGTLVLSPAGAEPVTLDVTDTHESGGVIWHTVQLPSAVAAQAFAPGTPALCRIDWDARFDRMQQHSGEHILSGTLHRLYSAENVGFHIGAELVRMDTDLPLGAESLRQAEWEANRVIWADHEIRAWYPAPEELAELAYRSKKQLTGPVRIVEIPGADCCACCGTHVARTGQVGSIKILSAEAYKGGTRLFLACGGRALREAQGMRARQAEIGALLSARSAETAAAVHRLYEDYTALKFAKYGLEEQLFAAKAALTVPGEKAILTVPGLAPDGMHRLAARLCEGTDALCAVLTPPPAEGGPTGYCLAQHQPGPDVRVLAKRLNEAFAGRGGGKPGMCQGSCTGADAAALAAWLNAQ